MSEWRPIETRPDEGEFYAYDPISGTQDVCRASVNDVYDYIDKVNGTPFTTRRGKVGERKSCDAVQSDGEYGPYEDQFQGDRATHWAPLLPNPNITLDAQS